MAGKEKTIQKATQVALGKLIDLARASDPSALKTLSEYGLNPGRAGVFRFISEGEANNILNGGRYLGRFGDGRVDVTSNDAVTTGLSDAFRVQYKPEFDLYKGGDRVRLKNEELGDGWLLGGYDLNDVAAIQKKLPDGTYQTIYDPSIIRTVQDNGKIRLSLPTHTVEKPRQFVLEPTGDNKFYIHMRTWDGDHIPANLSFGDKQVLFNALYNELPEAAEILFPKSGPGNYATRGTVAGLQRLARDSRFTPGTNGILQYLDKDGRVKTYEGTSFIKSPRITPENAASITPEQWTAALDAAVAKALNITPKEVTSLTKDQFNTAVANGADMTEAQRLRDLHAGIKGYSPTHEYHGSNKSFKEFKESPHGIYFTPDKFAAESYARGLSPTKYDVYLNSGDDIVTIDNGGLPWNKISETIAADAFGVSKEDLHSIVGRYNPGAQPWYYDYLYPFGFRPKTNYYAIDQLAEAAKQQGKTSLNLTNAVDNGKKITAIKNKLYDQHIVFKPNQIKSADAVTFDDNGTRIPLGKRDNFNINDIRWVLVPTAAGLSIKAASDNTFDKPLYNPNSPIF